MKSYLEFRDGHKEEILKCGRQDDMRTIQTSSGFYRDNGRNEKFAKLDINVGGTIKWVPTDEVRRVWSGDLKAYPIEFHIGNAIMAGEILLRDDKDITNLFGKIQSAPHNDDEIYVHRYNVVY